MKIFSTILLLTCSSGLFAQKKTFDIVSYTAPSGWKEELSNTYISYSKINTGSWGQIAVYKSIQSKGDIESDMQSEWETVVLPSRTVENDQKTPATNVNGWTVASRSGTWKFNGADVASILTVYTNGKTCISFLCNTTEESFLKEFIQMTQSVELPAVQQNEAGNKAPAVADTKPSSVIGLWGSYINETSGYINGMPMYSGGYFRREYVFYDDGTYLYRSKDWSTLMKDICFVYETGTYKISGNQMTITPVKGKGEWWSKAASGRTTEWGRRVKAADIKLEKITYTFEIKYLSGMQKSYLYLRHNKSTQRDGSQSSQANAMQEFSYGKRGSAEDALIDNPPGVKTGFEGKK